MTTKDRFSPANLSFADGHVKWMKWNWPKVFHSYNQAADPQQDLQDLRNLQQLLPHPP